MAETLTKAELTKIFGLEKKLMDPMLELMDNVTFKREGLGALEFDFEVGNDNFEQIKHKFRVERVPQQTILSIQHTKDEAEKMKKLFENTVVEPVGANKIEFYEFDNEAMAYLSIIINKFLDVPFRFVRKAGTGKGTTKK